MNFLDDRLLYSLSDVAKMFSVQPDTVKGWARHGKIVSRLRAFSGGKVRRVFALPELMEFIDRQFPIEGTRPESLAERIMAKHKAHSAKGKRQSTSSSGSSSPPVDP